MKSRATGRTANRPKGSAGKAPGRQAIGAKEPAANTAVKATSRAATAKKSTAARKPAALSAAAARAELGSILARIHRTLDETENLLAD